MSEDIRGQIDKCYSELEESLDFSSFTFQPKSFETYKKIHELQNRCTHRFLNGKCVYCDLEEKNDSNKKR